MEFHALGVCWGSNDAPGAGAATPADPLGLLGGCNEPALVRAPSEDLAAGTNSAAFLLRPRTDADAVSGKTGKSNGDGDNVSLTTVDGPDPNGVVSPWLPRDDADALRLIAAELFALVAAFLSPNRSWRAANFWSSTALPEDDASGGDVTAFGFNMVTGTRAGAGKASGAPFTGAAPEAEATAPLPEPGPDELPAVGAELGVN